MSENLMEIELEIPEDAQNPVEPFLRMERMPHIWCPGCGIGTTVVRIGPEAASSGSKSSSNNSLSARRHSTGLAISASLSRVRRSVLQLESRLDRAP